MPPTTTANPAVIAAKRETVLFTENSMRVPSNGVQGQLLSQTPTAPGGSAAAAPRTIMRRGVEEEQPTSSEWRAKKCHPIDQSSHVVAPSVAPSCDHSRM